MLAGLEVGWEERSSTTEAPRLVGVGPVRTTRKVMFG